MIRKYSNKEILEMIGERSRIYRKNMGISQRQLSESTGLSLSTVQKYEAGKANISLDSLLTILRALGQIESIDRLLPEQPLSPYTEKNRS